MKSRTELGCVKQQSRTQSCSVLVPATPPINVELCDDSEDTCCSEGIRAGNAIFADNSRLDEAVVFRQHGEEHCLVRVEQTVLSRLRKQLRLIHTRRRYSSVGELASTRAFD